MGGLKALQDEFLAFYQEKGGFLKRIKEGGATPKNRAEISLGNIGEALKNSLSLIFPLTWKLIGEECANGAVYTFVREIKNLPTHGVLQDWGKEFPDFLSTFPPTEELGYLPDFARLEWLTHVSSGVQDAAPLSASAFEGLSPADFENLTLSLHPSVYLMTSPFPLDQVLAVVKEEADSADLEDRAVHLLISRLGTRIELHWLPERDYLFFEGLREGGKLLALVNKLGMSPEDLNKVLSYGFQKGLFLGYTL